VATELWLTIVWSLGRADHSHPSKHALIPTFSVVTEITCSNFFLFYSQDTLSN
jgi:hypothetical protein